MSTHIFNVRASENQCANKTTTNHHCQIYEQTVVRGQCVAWLKRLEKGRFHWPQPAAQGASRKVVLTQAELTLLLAGIDLEGAQRRAWHRVE